MSDHYCTVNDVNKLVPQAPFSNASKPRDVDVQEFIESTAKRMDAWLGNRGYTVPITGTNSVAMAREACAWGALGLAQQVRDTAVKTAVTESGRPVKNVWLQMFEQWLDSICDSDASFRLTDAPRTDQEVEKDHDLIMSGPVEASDDERTTTIAQVF